MLSATPFSAKEMNAIQRKFRALVRLLCICRCRHAAINSQTQQKQNKPFGFCVLHLPTMAAIAIICTIVLIGTVSVLPLLPVKKQRAGFLPPVVSFGYPKMGIAIPVSYPKMGIVFRKIILHYPHNGATSDTIPDFPLPQNGEDILYIAIQYRFY
jgi:hypothetical protein